jgi:hypothetical protein
VIEALRTSILEPRDHLHIKQKSETLWPGGSGMLARYILVAALDRVRQLTWAWPRSLPRRPAPAANRPPVWITGLSGRGPGCPPRPAMRRMPGVRPRLMGAYGSGSWTVSSV